MVVALRTIPSEVRVNLSQAASVASIQASFVALRLDESSRLFP